MARLKRLALCATPALAALAIAACGSGGDHATTSPVIISSTKADRRPALPERWHRIVNPRAGLNLGIPPGWTARPANAITVLRAADRALAISVTADRSDEGLTFDPRRYAIDTASHLDGFERLHRGVARMIPGAHYPTAILTATGVARRSGIAQVISVYAIHARNQATASLIVFRSTAAPAVRYAALLRGIARSVRFQPPQ